MPPPQVQIIAVSPVSLPHDALLRRDPPRPPELRPPGYEEQFDDRTLFYDIFRCDDAVSLVGPPLRNLEAVALDGLAASGRSEKVKTTQLHNVQRTTITGIHRTAMTIDFPLEGSRCSATIGSDLAQLFRERKVLLTVSKNNDLAWVQDWIKFHARYHGVDAVLIYDNGSTSYSLAQLQSAIEQVDDIELAAIVAWPFKFGPQGFNHTAPGSNRFQQQNGPDLPWDSDYCQYGALEHAKWRFLRHAAGVINADVDELVLTPPGTTIFDYVRRSRGGVVQYPGIWIEAIPTGSTTKSSYSNCLFRTTVDDNFGGPSKWCLIPHRVPARSQWTVHSVEWDRSWIRPWTFPWKYPLELSLISYRHFAALNTGWKEPLRLVNPEMNPDEYHLDVELRDALSHVDM